MTIFLKPEHQRIIDRVMECGQYSNPDQVLEMPCEDIEDLCVAEKRLGEGETSLSAGQLRKNLALDK
jgi:hypothetical protein